ncbi:MAG: hypothetical protein MUE85_01110 [Microscillaceae bacterium]|jgi:hypothetical protein|nr:hypothetical protein [Microscillaceae bacterium]
MNLEDLKIDLSTFRTPIVVEEEGMFVTDDAIYTNNVGYLQTEEGVFFTGTVFNPWGFWLKEYQDGLEHGRSVFFFEKDRTVFYEKIYIEARFIAGIDAEGKLIKHFIFERDLFLAWLDADGYMLKERCYQANNF